MAIISIKFFLSLYKKCTFLLTIVMSQLKAYASVWNYWFSQVRYQTFGAFFEIPIKIRCTSECFRNFDTFNSKPFAKSRTEPSLGRFIEQCSILPPLATIVYVSTLTKTFPFNLFSLALPWILNIFWIMKYRY